jgi:triosephosphate isomerase
MTVARRRLIVGNWKMNLGERAARDLVTSLCATFPFDRVDAAVAPAFPCLRAALDAAKGSPLAVAAQNVHAEDRGAFTGEVAGPMLSEMGVRYVIVGHSERRQLFGETDEVVARKLAATHRHGLIPVLCVGETLAQREAGRTRDVVLGQLRAAVGDAGEPFPLVVAYEPVWAIGTGLTPASSDVSDAHASIRDSLTRRFGAAAERMRILYGGSATRESAASLLAARGVDGALVGGASLDAESFAAIGAIAAAGA